MRFCKYCGFQVSDDTDKCPQCSKYIGVKSPTADEQPHQGTYCLANEYRTTVSSLLRRAELYLEDKEWNFASNYYENVLDIDPENAHAYIGLLMASLKITKESDLKKVTESFEQLKYFLKAMRFADNEYKALLQEYCNDNIYFRAQQILECAKTAADFGEAKGLLLKIADQIDVEELLNKCEVEEARLHQKEQYEEAQKLMNSSIISDLNTAIQIFEENDLEASALNIEKCKNRIAAIEAKRRKKQRKTRIAIISIISIVGLSMILIFSAITDSNNKKAEEIYHNFLDLSFSGSIEDDDGFASGYLNGDLDQYQIYRLTTEERTLKFNSDGTIYCTYTYDNTVLAHPKIISKPKNYHSESDYTHDSFSVYVSLGGKVYVTIGGANYKVSINSDNVPQSIYDYYGMTLS